MTLESVVTFFKKSSSYSGKLLFLLPIYVFLGRSGLTRDYECLKVPKREIFVTELFILSDPIWVGDLRNEPKNLLCKVLG